MKRSKRTHRKNTPHKGLFDYPKHTKTIFKSAKNINDGQESKILDEETEHLHTLAEAIPQIVWTADAKGYQDYFNKRWFEYTGLTELETYTGKSALHPDDFPIYAKRWSQALRSGKAYEAEYRFRRDDDMYRWHLVRGVPVKDDKGNILKWFGTFTDIHDKKETEERINRMNEELEKRVQRRTKELKTINQALEKEIREREKLEEKDYANIQRLNRTIGILPMGALITDENRIILHVNETLCKLFNLQSSPADWIGKHLSLLIDSFMKKMLDPGAALRTIELTLNSKKPDINKDIPLQDGRILLRDYLPITDHGKPRGHLFLYRDVTRERRIDASKSEFMSLASHQLRTPLTAIRWALGRLGRSMEANDPRTSTIESARTATANMADTINTMLLISHLEAGNLHLELKSFSVCTFLHEIKTFNGAYFKKRDQKFTVQCHSALRLQSDKKILSEILQNLISNAIKYTPREGKISIKARQGKKKTLVLQVADTGFGIPQYQQDKVFSKFFRADNVLQEITEGNGLGLYLVSSLVRLLNGKITFKSQENKGTVFTLILPLRSEPNIAQLSDR